MFVPFRFLLALALAAEVVVTVLVAQAIGVGWTLLWLAAAFLLGLVVLRRAASRGAAAVRRSTRDGALGAAAGAAGAGDAALLLVAGLLLAFPGFLGDAVGLLLLLPPVRRLVASTAVASAARRFPVVRTTFTRVRLGSDAVVIPGEVVEEPDDGEDGPGRGPRPPRGPLPPGS